MIVDGKVFPYKRKIVKLFKTAEKILNENFENVNVSVNFVSEDEIQKLNKNFRAVDRATDVLSFPNLDKKHAQKVAEFLSESDENGIIFWETLSFAKRLLFVRQKNMVTAKTEKFAFWRCMGFCIFWVMTTLKKMTKS